MAFHSTMPQAYSGVSCESLFVYFSQVFPPFHCSLNTRCMKACFYVTWALLSISLSLPRLHSLSLFFMLLAGLKLPLPSFFSILLISLESNHPVQSKIAFNFVLFYEMIVFWVFFLKLIRQTKALLMFSLIPCNRCIISLRLDFNHLPCTVCPL